MRRRWKRYAGLVAFIISAFVLAVGIGMISQPEATVNAPWPQFAYEKDMVLTVYITSVPIRYDERKSMAAYVDEFRRMIADACAVWDFDVIEVKINSRGGWVTPAIALAKVLSGRPEYVKMIIWGHCQSAAVNLLAFSDPDEVTITRTGNILTHHRHRVGGNDTGNPEEEINGIAKLTGQPVETVRNWFDTGKLFTPQEARACGWTGKKQ